MLESAFLLSCKEEEEEEEEEEVAVVVKTHTLNASVL